MVNLFENNRYFSNFICFQNSIKTKKVFFFGNLCRNLGDYNHFDWFRINKLIKIDLSVFLCVCLFVCLSVCLFIESIYLSIDLSFCHMFIYYNNILI